MAKDTSQVLNTLKNNDEILLKFLKAKFPVFHNSNFFFRDFQYGIRSFLEKKDIIVTYKESEKLANDIAEHFMDRGIFQRVNSQGWKVNYPEFAAVEAGDPF
jgi:hypothetical protein